jgi:lactoylglutathione lyase
MKTLHFGLRVADLDRSLAFYTALGYEVVGSVPETPIGHLTMLKLPADEFVTIELVHDSTQPEGPITTGLSHFVIKVESLDATVSQLAGQGIDVDPPPSPADSTDVRTTLITDPDGNRIELVEWPAGHADGMSGKDFVQ